MREYLERKSGCGRKGKLNNIAGIAKSTEDDVNNDNIAEIAKSTTEDYHYSTPAVKQAPKPKTIPQVINAYHSNKMAYVPNRYSAPAVTVVRQPATQVTVARNQAARPTLSDYESKSQNLALSFKSNSQYTTTEQSSLEHNGYNTQQGQSQIQRAYDSNDQYSRLASNNNNIYEPQTSQHDLWQTFYPDTLHERSQAPATVAVGKPLFIKRPFTRPQASMQVQNAPNKVPRLLKNAMKKFDKVSVNNPPGKTTFNGAPAKPHIYNKPAIKLGPSGAKISQDENVDDAHADMRDPENAADNNNLESIDDKPVPEPRIDSESADQSTNKQNMSPQGKRPGTELKPIKPDANFLNSLKKPVAQQVSVSKGNPTFVNQPQHTRAQSPSAPTLDSINLNQPSINFDVLKDKIMHSTNATFLRRMLALIQKITHHKDYQKLQGPARNFVAQANTAVQALSKAYRERVPTSPANIGIGNQLYGNDYGLRKKSAVQMPTNVAYSNRAAMSPGYMGTGSLYGNAYALRKKTTVPALNSAYNNRLVMSSVNPGTGNQLYGNHFTLAKKFLIARNPYYQSYYQYRQPYYSNIQSMRYGLYNGNIP